MIVYDLHQLQAFMRDLDAFDGDLVGVGLEIGRGDLHRKAARRRPGRDRLMLLVQQPDGHVAALVHAVVGDLVEPGVVVEVVFELAALQREVVVLHHARHGDLVESPCCRCGGIRSSRAP